MDQQSKPNVEVQLLLWTRLSSPVPKTLFMDSGMRDF